MPEFQNTKRGFERLPCSNVSHLQYITIFFEGKCQLSLTTEQKSL